MFDILGIDFGTKRIGLALGSSDSRMAVPHEVIENNTNSISIIRSLLKEEGIKTIVVGRPVALNQEQTEMTAKVESWTKKLKDVVSQEIFFEDERMTSSMVENIERDLPKEKHHTIDSVSAMLILQGFMDKNVNE